MLMNARKNVLLLGAVYQLGALAIFVCILAVLMTDMNHAKASGAWPHANGVVTCGAESRQLFDQNKIGRTWYEYEVYGKRFRCDRVSFFENNAIYNFPEGKEVKVFYNPKNVEEACLVNGVTKEAMWTFYFYSFAILIGLYASAQLWFTYWFVNLDKNCSSTGGERLAGYIVAGTLVNL